MLSKEDPDSAALDLCREAPMRSTEQARESGPATCTLGEAVNKRFTGCLPLEPAVRVMATCRTLPTYTTSLADPREYSAVVLSGEV